MYFSQPTNASHLALKKMEWLRTMFSMVLLQKFFHFNSLHSAIYNLHSLLILLRTGMTSDTNGILYIATFGGHKIMKVDPR